MNVTWKFALIACSTQPQHSKQKISPQHTTVSTVTHNNKSHRYTQQLAR